jgi:hypothetical protein
VGCPVRLRTRNDFAMNKTLGLFVEGTGVLCKVLPASYTVLSFMNRIESIVRVSMTVAAII